MTDAELDELLRRIPDEPRSETKLDDGRLLALASGAEDETLEIQLARDPEGRALLDALTEPVPEALVRRAEAMTMRRHRARVFVIPIVASVLAAAFALLWLRPWAPREPVPIAYSIEGPLGGVHEVRGDGASSSRLLPTSRLRLIARPEREPTGDEPVLRVFAEHGQRLVEAPRTAIETGLGGAVRFEIRAGELFDEPGRWVLHALLVPPDAVQTNVRNLTDLASLPAVHRHAMSIDYDVVARPNEPEEEIVP